MRSSVNFCSFVELYVWLVVVTRSLNKDSDLHQIAGIAAAAVVIKK